MLLSRCKCFYGQFFVAADITQCKKLIELQELLIIGSSLWSKERCKMKRLSWINQAIA
jgi:hypothetical protein